MEVEDIDISLHYRLSDFKNEKLMYKKILEDVERLRDILLKYKNDIGGLNE